MHRILWPVRYRKTVPDLQRLCPHNRHRTQALPISNYHDDHDHILQLEGNNNILSAPFANTRLIIIVSMWSCTDYLSPSPPTINHYPRVSNPMVITILNTHLYNIMANDNDDMYPWDIQNLGLYNQHSTIMIPAISDT